MICSYSQQRINQFLIFISSPVYIHTYIHVTCCVDNVHMYVSMYHVKLLVRISIYVCISIYVHIYVRIIVYIKLLQVHNLTKNKWFVLIAKHSKEKQEWMDAIRREKAKGKSNKINCPFVYVVHY